MNSLEQTLQIQSIAAIHGPAERLGGRCFGSATGKSYYVRDPDQNLLEFIVYTLEN
jgi:hypothetical protein